MWSNMDVEAGEGPNEVPQAAIVSQNVPPELLARSMPAVVNVNMNKSTGMHVGPKFEFVTITQVVENRESNRATRAPPNRDTVKKKRSWLGLCSAGLALGLLISVALTIYLVVILKTSEALLPEDVPWRVTREMWDSAFYHDNRTLDEFRPIRLVIVQHTVSAACFDFQSCAAAMRNLQEYFLGNPDLGYDLPYNFVIGNDGRVYDSRLWNREGAHTAGYSRCSIGIAFMGDYRDDINIQDRSRVTDRQMSRLRMLLEEGVLQGHLSHDYYIVGGRDLHRTYSPGENLYRALESLEHFGGTKFRGLTCGEIYGL